MQENGQKKSIFSAVEGQKSKVKGHFSLTEFVKICHERSTGQAPDKQSPPLLKPESPSKGEGVIQSDCGREVHRRYSFLSTTAGFMRVTRRVCRAVTAAETAQIISNAAAKISGLSVIRCT